MKISVFDTSLSSDNLGDQIIMESARAEIRAALPHAVVSHVAASHRYLRPKDYIAQRRSHLSVLGGTNALKSHMFIRGNWKVTPLDIWLLRDVVLLGVGWQQYQGEIDFLSKRFFRNALSPDYIHSVRDSHSLRLLGSCLRNVVNTSCPTLWRLDAEFCRRIPVRKARKVVFALTYYSPDKLDIEIYNYLKSVYETVYFWPQQEPDVAYAGAIGAIGMTMIEPSLASYDAILDDEDVDFVGARLHGGIRALQRGRRALILAVDNRAVEISRDTGLTALPRQSLTDIKAWVERPEPFAIRLPTAEIDAWRGQFRRV